MTVVLNLAVCRNNKVESCENWARPERFPRATIIFFESIDGTSHDTDVDTNKNIIKISYLNLFRFYIIIIIIIIFVYLIICSILYPSPSLSYFTEICISTLQVFSRSVQYRFQLLNRIPFDIHLVRSMLVLSTESISNIIT